MILATVLIFCCTSLSADTATSDHTNSNRTEETTAAKAAQHSPPDAPLAKSDSSRVAEPAASIEPGNTTPKSDPLLNSPVKPALHGSYEAARQRKIWYGLMAASHGAAFYDAYTTRQAISGGYGVEGDPLLRPFANSNAMYAATQVSPAIMDYFGHRMMTSNHEWMRRLWWVPQVAGTSLSLSAAIHNSRLKP